MSALVDESAPDPGARQSAGDEVVRRDGVLSGLGWWLVVGLVGSVPVVVARVGREDLTCVGLSDDGDVVEGFASDAPRS
jgi:hypothetical protein